MRHPWRLGCGWRFSCVIRGDLNGERAPTIPAMAICPRLPKSRSSRLDSFCLETLSNGRCAVIDRAYSVDSAIVGAVYDRPICSFETETSSRHIGQESFHCLELEL